MAHIDAGKTTCAERILFVTGVIRLPGEVHHGNTVLDFDRIEKKRKITIGAAATSVSWLAHRVQIIDTPGHVDFTFEVERSLRVLDGAVFVLDAGSGVECQSETVFRQADKHGVPSLAFVNKLDKVGSSFETCLVEIRERLGIEPAPVHLPIGEGTPELAILDVLREKLVRFEDRGKSVVLEDVPSEHREAVAKAKERLVVLCSEHDEELFARYCAGPVDMESLTAALRRLTLARKVMVVTCGSALKNVGIPTLLDAVVAYLPSPLDRDPSIDDDAPLAALAFKTVHETRGHLTFVRVYSGTLRAGARVSVNGRSERVSHVYLPHASERNEVDDARSGAVVAVAGLRDARTGDTIGDPDSPITLEPITAPEPVVEIAVEPRTNEDRDKLSLALARLLFDDPSLRSTVDAETGQLRLAGMGKLHLEVVIDRLEEDHRVKVIVGKPEVAWRETIARASSASYRHIKQDGGAGQFACVSLTVAPASRGSGIAFENAITGGVIRREWVPAVEKGIRGAAERGVFAGHRLVDVIVTLTDGEEHAKDSSAYAFEIAGSLAFQAACRSAGVVVLEPQCAVEVTVPEEHVGAVVGDLGASRGIVGGIAASRGTLRVVSAEVPLAETFDYVTRLRGLTHGRGTAVMRPSRYAPAPAVIANEVLGR
jgi:elongation factor G